MKYIINLGKVAYDSPAHKTNTVDVEVELRSVQYVAPRLTVDFKPVPADAVEMTICGAIWNGRHTKCASGGQIVDEIKRLFSDNRSVQRLCEIWDRWHLNDMNAGCRIQNEALKAFKFDRNKGDHYAQACEFLKTCDGYQVPTPVGGTYKYGDAWLFEEIPVEVMRELMAIIKELGGKKAEA